VARHLSVSAVQAEGRKILLDSADGTHLLDPPHVPAGSRLVAVVNNGEWQSAVDVTFPDAYQKVGRRYQDGIWKAMELYLIDEQRAVQIEDARRVTMDGQPVKDPGRVS
jgi:hypothetical protein